MAKHKPEKQELTASKVLVPVDQKNSNTDTDEIPAIKALCQTFNISQAALSRRFSIPIRTVEDWYAGRRKPPDYVVRMMSELLDEKN